MSHLADPKHRNPQKLNKDRFVLCFNPNSFSPVHYQHAPLLSFCAAGFALICVRDDGNRVKLERDKIVNHLLVYETFYSKEFP